MHFFTDHILLPTQADADMRFGPNKTNPCTEFDLSTQFQLTTPAKAFACQDGQMIIQESSTDSGLVNVVIKPIEGLKIPFKAVKYFIYRGLAKDSFINGSDIISQGAGNSEFIARFWREWNDYKTDTNQPALPNPGVQSLGYDRALPDEMDVENIYDNSQPDNIRAIFVKEGEWIGNFAATSISFEIVVETNNVFDLAFLRNEKYQINVTGLSGLDLRAKREEILSFIDPAAFFGLHYDEGVSVSTYNGNTKTTEKKKEEELYASLLGTKFANKNNLYLDIRSEKGYSYNFHQNYGDEYANIKVGNSDMPPEEEMYEWASWPLMMIDKPVATSENKNNLIIVLRIDDNTKPILFCENKDAISGNHTGQFIENKDIIEDSSPEWSKEIGFIFPNTGTGESKSNVAYYLQLHYFRQEESPSSPGTVLSNKYYFTSAFCPIDLPYLGDGRYLFRQSSNANFNFIQGEITGLGDFSYVSRNGAYWDDSRMIFFSKALHPNRSTKYFFSPSINSGLNPGFNLNGNINQMSFLSKNIHIGKNNIQEIVGNEAYQKVETLQLLNYNESPNSFESILCLGITQNQFQILKNATGFSERHHRYIYIEEVSGSPFNDKDGYSFRKFKLKTQGVDNNGKQLIIDPPTDIFVYNTSDLLFASKEFAEQEISPSGLVYMRNYEENIGHVKVEETTHKRYEDYFIETINPRMKVEVDGFINALASIAVGDPNAYQNIKTLVEDSAQDIWNEAVSFVQANNNANPDDRPLYWARNKMEVALKSHPYFENQFSFSKVNPRSELEKMIKFFEEKSRNYTGVDFSGAPVGTKKILITGFDPFFLNENHTLYGRYNNIRQSNPSGVCALALHNTRTENELGYIQSMIVPVRYADFDNTNNKENGQGEGIVENYIKRYLEEADAIITISQATPNDYHIDIFATATRGGTIDNLGFTRMENSKSVNNLSPETIVTTLPDEFVQGHPKTIFYGKYQMTKHGALLDSSKNNYPSSKVYSGPGGNYLSNEIFYRVALLREEWIKSKLPNIVPKATGHFHISKLQDESIKEDFNSSKTQILLDIVKKTINQGITGL